MSIALASVMLTILSSFANEGRGNGRVRILDGRTLDDFESIPKFACAVFISIQVFVRADTKSAGWGLWYNHGLGHIVQKFNYQEKKS